MVKVGIDGKVLGSCHLLPLVAVITNRVTGRRKSAFVNDRVTMNLTSCLHHELVHYYFFYKGMGLDIIYPNSARQYFDTERLFVRFVYVAGSENFWETLFTPKIGPSFIGTMKLQCDVEVINRMLPTFGMKSRGKGARAVLSIGRHVDKTTQKSSIYLLICTAKDRAGSKYKVSSCLLVT